MGKQPWRRTGFLQYFNDSLLAEQTDCPSKVFSLFLGYYISYMGAKKQKGLKYSPFLHLEPECERFTLANPECKLVKSNHKES